MKVGKNMKKKLYFITGIILIIYVAIVNVKSATKIAFSGPVIIFSIMMIVYAIKMESIKKYVDRRKYLKNMTKLIKICFVFFICVFMMIECVIIGYPKHDTSNSDYILVLGAGLKNGYEPSAILRYRLNAAIECIETYGNTGKIVVSGGKGNDEQIPEGEAMKKYLIDNGIEEERILVENQSKSTAENFKFSKGEIEKDSGRSIKEVNVKIVTTDFHALRSRFLAKNNGYDKISNYSSETVWYLIPISYLREGFAVIKSVLFD